MAEPTTQADVADAGGGKKKTIVMIVGGLVLVAAGIVAGLMIMNVKTPPESEDTTAEQTALETKAPPIYQTLHPPLVVNVKDEAGDSHFMQITMEVMSRDQGVVNAVRDNVAVIRNALILLYGSSIYEEVSTRDGKQKMLDDGLAEIERVMIETTGKGGVEALYFTALVIQ